MYTTAKRMALISTICCAGNLFGLVLLILCANGLNISFALAFSMVIILSTNAAVSLMLTLGLRSLCQDLVYEFENNTKKFNELNQKIKEIEAKI